MEVAMDPLQRNFQRKQCNEISFKKRTNFKKSNTELTIDARVQNL